MKTPLIYIKSSGDGISEALSATEKLGAESGLSERSVLRLRLLAEELTGLLRGIAGDTGASYRAEGENGSFELRLRSEVGITDGIREQFISASSGRENSSAKGVTGKIRMIVAGIMLALSEADAAIIPADTLAAMPAVGHAGGIAFLWSMASYRDEVRKRSCESPDSSREWDELEKSVLASLADDVRVGIVGKKVEITVSKAFDDPAVQTAKTGVLTVGTGQGSVAGALGLAEQAGEDCGLDRKSVLHLRLLSEELLGLLRGIAGDAEAKFWIERRGMNFTLHLTSDLRMNDKMKEMLLSASSDGENSLARGFTGKIRMTIANMICSAAEAAPYALSEEMSAYTDNWTVIPSASYWSMSAYAEDLERKRSESEEVSKLWDELEKSILAKTADDVKVGIAGTKVEITVSRAF